MNFLCVGVPTQRCLFSAPYFPTLEIWKLFEIERFPK